MSGQKTFPIIAISATGLACARGGFDVFEGLDFALSGGQALVLRGPNGVGKSSALLAICGQIPLKDGSIQWVGLDDDTPPETAMHMVGHLTGIKPSLTVAENLRFWATLYGGGGLAVTDALEAAGLGGLAHFEAGILSAGQSRRLALARLLVSPRPLWLLDEPTSALDTQGADWVRALIGRHLDSGGMAIIATHLDIGIEDRPSVRQRHLERLAA